MEKISTLGIDLAKNTFQLHAAGKRGEKLLYLFSVFTD